MNSLEFWATKNPATEYETITIAHKKFGEINLVANCFDSQIFEGKAYIPVAMRVKRPDIGQKMPVAELTLSFSRAQIGEELEKHLYNFEPSDFMTPVSVIYKRFTELDRDIFIDRYDLVIAENGIKMNADTVEIRAVDDNELILGVASIYTIEEYIGLDNA